MTSVNEVHCVDFQRPLPYRGALCRCEATIVGAVSQLTTPMQSADLSWTDADSQWEKVYAAAKIHMDFLEGTFKETFFLFSRVVRSLGTAPWWYHAYAM